MGFDRNTVIGFVLLGLLLFAYLFISTKNSQELQKQQKLVADSIANVRAHEAAQAKLRDTAKTATAVVDSGVNANVTATEHMLTVENELLKVVFSNKGGQPVTVELKKFKSYDSTPVKLVAPGTDSRLSYSINKNNQAEQVSEQFFSEGQLIKNADGSQTLSYTLPVSNGASLIHQFTIRPNDYRIDWNVTANGADKLFTQNSFNLIWHANLGRTQQHAVTERRLTSVCYMEDEGFDFISQKSEKTFEKPVKWISVAHQFFNTTLIAGQGNSFTSGNVHLIRETNDTSNTLGRAEVNMQAKFPAAASATLPFQIYYGPNDFYILEKQATGMTKIIDLGRGIYSFVRPINVYIIMPVFNFFKSHIASYGIAILLLTLFIRLITSPLVYSSYLSGAKMKALRPEIEAMKKRVGNDQQQVGMEQMKLFREAGVNPLGGCIPALLQIPIFFALYSFFNSNIGLRGIGYLWAPDLSTYDSILNFGFSIPGYGDHVSLFALLAVVTSFLISLYGMSMTPDQSNPAMKYMPYIMPVMLLLFFNNLAAALTWYYTVSNVITLILQFVIQHYIIDHDKILAKLQENRTKPKTKTKWQERLEQMQEAQKQAQKARK